MNEFMTIESLTTFSGLVLAVTLITQFTKSIIKKKFEDYIVRIYVFFISLILTSVFAGKGFNASGFILTFINSIIVTMASIGGYELVVDPLAKKRK